ncbi:HigA family addiction module antidote protein [Liquorilactobacillus satsumensis]|nr:HigA family addiction module antitoxin [Liquorilactobacillus satsumensis]MCP9357133.1 HigA family addiction module antidote protein [Liquorilactobacillus satsumensis]MCP9371080.1 HigA family addiction module antidote protein [Liquorilactobacillus satsumensis]
MAIKLYEVEPDYATSPGVTLKETLHSLDMTQVEVAKRLNITEKHLSNIINENVKITSGLAAKLELTLGVSANFWLTLDKNFIVSKEKIKQEKNLDRQTIFLHNFNYADMANKGFVSKTRKKSEKVRNLLSFFRFPTFEVMEKHMLDNSLLEGAYRLATKQGEIDKYALMAWINQGDILATQIKTASFNKELAKSKVQEMRSLINDTDPSIFIPKLQKIAASFGVAVIFVPELKGSKICGLTRWLTPYPKAIIQLSLRYKRNDSLWFTFFHELAHLILHKKKAFYTFKGEYVNSEEEKQADKFAANVLIPDIEWESFMSKGRFDERSVREFAEKVNINTGIVVGRLQKKHIIDYSQMNNYIVRYRWQ